VPSSSGQAVKEWLLDYVDHGSANIFCKGPNSKYFRLCGPRGKLEDIYDGRLT
jgi:hypothetical protein